MEFIHISAWNPNDLLVPIESPNDSALLSLNGNVVSFSANSSSKWEESKRGRKKEICCSNKSCRGKLQLKRSSKKKKST